MYRPKNPASRQLRLAWTNVVVTPILVAVWISVSLRQHDGWRVLWLALVLAGVVQPVFQIRQLRVLRRDDS